MRSSYRDLVNSTPSDFSSFTNFVVLSPNQHWLEWHHLRQSTSFSPSVAMRTCFTMVSQNANICELALKYWWGWWKKLLILQVEKVTFLPDGGVEKSGHKSFYKSCCGDCNLSNLCHKLDLCIWWRWQNIEIVLYVIPNFPAGVSDS